MADIPEDSDAPVLTFLDRMLDQVNTDKIAGDQYLDQFRKDCTNTHKAYHNAREYAGLRKENKFPIPKLQKHIDYFVADTQDKIWYAGEPCSVVPREDTDKEDADAKQQMLRYQDEEDKTYGKYGLWLRDCGLYRMCVAQVDYEEKTRLVWSEEPVFQYAYDPNGSLVVDEAGQPKYAVNENGEPIVLGEQWVREEKVVYKGATTRRIDPQDVIFTADKQEIDDEFPVMIRSEQTKKFFKSEDYFFNQDLLNEEGAIINRTESNPKLQKGNIRGLKAEGTKTKKTFEYVEWQGQVEKYKLYGWLAQERPEEYQELIPEKLYMETYKQPDGQDIRQIIEIKNKYEMCWCICGVVDTEVVVRLDVSPFDYPNIVIGFVTAEEEGLVGLGLAERIQAIHDGMQDLMGMFIENLKQTVNAQWVINTGAIERGKGVLVNKAGAIIKTSGTHSINDVVKRIEPMQVSPDIHLFMQYLDQWGKDADGLQSPITGQGDKAAETLGEFSQIMSQATLRMRDYLKSFEDSFVKPLTRLRLDVNALYIDAEYAVRVLGKSGDAWRNISPRAVKSDVDLVCESSTRETQKAVLIQQILQFTKLAPQAIANGQPVRIDCLLAELAEVGFNWSEDKIHRILPLLAMEKEEGGPERINRMMAENALLSQVMMRMQMLMGMGGAAAAGTGQDVAQPTTEEDAIQSANQSNEPQIGQLEP